MFSSRATLLGFFARLGSGWRLRKLAGEDGLAGVGSGDVARSEEVAGEELGDASHVEAPAAAPRENADDLGRRLDGEVPHGAGSQPRPTLPKLPTTWRASIPIAPPCHIVRHVGGRSAATVA